MSKKIDNGGAAFPQLKHICLNEKNDAWGEIYATQGLSIRDHFAAAALQSIIIEKCELSYKWCNEITGEIQYTSSEFQLPSSEITGWRIYQTPMHRVSRLCYQYADAMIAARKEGDQP